MDDYLKRTEVVRAVKNHKRFEIGLNTLSSIERNRLVPPTEIIKAGSSFQVVRLKTYWEENILEENINE